MPQGVPENLVQLPAGVAGKFLRPGNEQLNLVNQSRCEETSDTIATANEGKEADNRQQAVQPGLLLIRRDQLRQPVNESLHAVGDDEGHEDDEEEAAQAEDQQEKDRPHGDLFPRQPVEELEAASTFACCRFSFRRHGLSTSIPGSSA